MKKLLVPFIPIATACLALSACGSSADEEGQAEGPIKLVQIAPLESQATSLPFMKTSAQAAVKEINANGGVGGRKLELTTCNDKYDPNESVRCAQEAVREKATAVVGSLSGFGPQIMPILEQANIPSVGGLALSSADATSKRAYLFDPGAVGGFAAIPAIAKARFGATKLALIQPETPSNDANVQFFEAGAKAAGVEIVETISVPLDAIDYTQYIARAEGAGATVLITPTPTVRLFSALGTSGSDLKVVGSNGNLSLDDIKEIGGDGEGTFLTAGTPQADESNEWGQQYVAAMKKYEPAEKVYASVGLRAYFAVHLMATVAETIDGDITNDSLVEALDKTDGLKFAWLEDLSFAEPGPIEGLPRVVSTLSFPSKVTDGTLVPEEAISPFAS